MLILWERSTTHFADVRINRLGNDFLKIDIAFHKLGSKAVGQPQNVVQHKNLPITEGASPNPNGRDGKPFGNFMRQVHWDSFEHDGKRTGFSYRLGIFKEPFTGTRLATRFLALDFEPTHAMNRLGGQPNVSHDRNIDVDDG